MQVVPYKEGEKTKKGQVADMFDNISHRYDLLNHTLSLGIDILWRKKAIKLLKPFTPQSVLDIATGTGDFAIEAVKLKPREIIGVDISEGMLEVGRKKIAKKSLTNIIELKYGDAESIAFEDNKFDAITVAFGVRNFENLKKGLSEMFRVTNVVSKDNAAYQYLPESVAAFPDGVEFLKILNEVGYKEAKCIPLTFGISSIYWARK